ncbi:hypothetical protein ID866_4274 [Astraeus odoratus]|nr:hypothetical protein ID866_4274 [Astraeus odoratus]
MTCPVSPRLALPPETLEYVFEFLSRSDLLAVIKTNSLFHRVAARVLYRTLLELQPIQAVLLVKTIAHNDLYPTFVRHIELDWADNYLTCNFLRLLNRALRRLRFLLRLTLGFTKCDDSDNIAWVLQGCTFSLKGFTTSICCGPLLTRFLGCQNSITDLCLWGMNSLSAPPLAPGALPNLTHLRMVLSSPTVTADFVRGRPLESVSMLLSPGDAELSLDALLLTSKPVTRLTVMSFDAGRPVSFLSEIAARLPWLEALHFVVPLIQDSPDVGSSLDDEGTVVALWHQACPTLKTVILPGGIIWALKSGEWLSWRDDAYPSDL